MCLRMAARFHRYISCVMFVHSICIQLDVERCVIQTSRSTILEDWTCVPMTEWLFHWNSVFDCLHLCENESREMKLLFFFPRRRHRFDELPREHMLM